MWAFWILLVFYSNFNFNWFKIFLKKSIYGRLVNILYIFSINKMLAPSLQCIVRSIRSIESSKLFFIINLNLMEKVKQFKRWSWGWRRNSTFLINDQFVIFESRELPLLKEDILIWSGKYQEKISATKNPLLRSLLMESVC